MFSNLPSDRSRSPPERHPDRMWGGTSLFHHRAPVAALETALPEAEDTNDDVGVDDR